MSLRMLPIVCSVLCMVNVVSSSGAIAVTCTAEECGRQLFLTSYLKNGSISEAQEAARVPPLAGTVESYSGYFTVDEKHDSNMFFWFFPAETARQSAPLVLWLEGGPGVSSIADGFLRGPYHLDDEAQIILSNVSWTKTMNALYIDNPVGTGFSFTRDTSGYSVNEDDVRRNLYSALYQFFQLFPGYQKNELFIAGFSYAGKFIPSLAYSIHENNPSASTKINLKGLAIGNGWLDPVNQLGYSEYLYNLGLIDRQTETEFAQIEHRISSLIKAKRYAEASRKLRSYTQDPTGSTGKTLFNNVTGMNSITNYVSDYTGFWMTVYRGFNKIFSNPTVRKALHAGNGTFEMNSVEVPKRLEADFAHSVAPWLEVLLDHYRVLIFNGQLDIICAYPMTMNYVYKLKWNGAEEYRAAKRRKWYVQGELAGYAKSGGNLTDVLVRNAGHSPDLDQPQWVLDLMQKFLKNDPIGTQ